MTNQRKLEFSHNLDAEKGLLGSILITSGKAMNRVSHLLEPSGDDFFYKPHQIIFAGMYDMHVRLMPIDLLTLTEFLRTHRVLDEIGGSSYLTELAIETISSAHIVQYATIVHHHSQLRRVLTAARRIAELSQNQDTPLGEVLEKAEKEIESVTRKQRDTEDKLELVDLDEWMRIARSTRNPAGAVEGLSTGIYKIDKLTQGFVPGELMIISGQTSHGKTALANNIVDRIVKGGKRAMFVTMEMTKREIAERFNLLTDDQDIGEGRVLLNNRSDLKYTDVKKLIKKAKEQGCDLVVIDHLHYFSRSVENSTAEISKIVKEFKEAAVLYELPIILICHVRKMAPKKHPTLEDLRDSSLIAQDADMVLIVWRDESPSATNPLEVEVALWKNRNRQKKHRREFLYADGIKLLEEDFREPSEIEKQRIAANNARLVGDKDDNEGDLHIPGWEENKAAG